jgi:hypothetical protein
LRSAPLDFALGLVADLLHLPVDVALERAHACLALTGDLGACALETSRCSQPRRFDSSPGGFVFGEQPLEI